MNSNYQIMVNPNSAGIDELTQIPGIGPDIARRIINGRPYESLADLTRISGIGPVLFEQIKPSLTLDPKEEEAEEDETIPEDTKLEPATVEEQDDTEITDDDEKLETKPDINEKQEFEEGQEAQPDTLEEIGTPDDDDSGMSGEPVPAEESPEGTPEPATPVTGISRSSAIGYALFAGILAMLLSIALSLGIIASINGGSLSFVTRAEFSQQQMELVELEKQSDLMAGELDGLQKRITNLESLNGRIGTLEKSVGAVQGEMDVAYKQLDEFSGELETVTQQIVGLAADVENFKLKLARSDNFFENLRDLLNNLYPVEVRP